MNSVGYVTPKPTKGSSKTQNSRFPSKSAPRLKEICYKVSLCEYCHRRSRTAFTGLANGAKMVGEKPILPEKAKILTESDPPQAALQKRRFPIDTRS